MTEKKILTRVGRLWAEAKGVVGLELVPAAGGGALPDFEPGSHIDVHIGRDPGLVRQYSLCNAPGRRDCYLIAVKREPASTGGSAFINDMLGVGDEVLISPPRSTFSLAPGARRHRLLAGGIGITPIFSMASALRARGHAFSLDYFARSQEEAAFRAILLQSNWGGVEFHEGLDVEDTQRVLSAIVTVRAPGDHLYVCGPPPFVDCVVRLCEGVWPRGTVHKESFGQRFGSQISKDDSFDVRLNWLGVDVHVGADETILDACDRAGILLDRSCEQGACATCVMKVIRGAPDHRDLILSDQDHREGQFTPCVSRSRERLLVLDRYQPDDGVDSGSPNP